jgi:hypothetical protein
LCRGLVALAIDSAQHRFAVAPVRDFPQSLDGRRNLRHKLLGPRGRRPAELGQMDHRHQFADPSQRRQEVVEHPPPQLVQSPDVFQSAPLTFLSPLARGAALAIFERGERLDGARLRLREEAVELAHTCRLAPPG